VAEDGGPCVGSSRTAKEMADWQTVPRSPHGGQVGRGPRTEAVALKESRNRGRRQRR
jgi:predicted Fe-S protein YdhL (DUF1289 family)